MADCQAQTNALAGGCDYRLACFVDGVSANSIVVERNRYRDSIVHKLKGKENMNTVVLVHGAFHGAWCWKKVENLLELIPKKFNLVGKYLFYPRSLILTEILIIMLGIFPEP